MKLLNKLNEKEKIEKIISIVQEFYDKIKKPYKNDKTDNNKINRLMEDLKSYKLSIALPSDAAEIMKLQSDDMDTIKKSINEHLKDLKQDDINRKMCFKMFYDLLN